MIKLRHATYQHVLDNTPLMELPVYFEGTYEQCETLAKKYNWELIRQQGTIYGGYWRNVAKECFIPT